MSTVEWKKEKRKIPWASKEGRRGSLQLVRAGMWLWRERSAKDQRCGPPRMGVWLGLTNAFKPGPAVTTEEAEATDTGMTQAWQMLTFLHYVVPTVLGLFIRSEHY